MGLPSTPVSADFIRDGEIKREVVKRKENGYAPTVEYFPTMRVVRCSKCGLVGVCEFLGGMNLKEGDRLMEGKPIRGECKQCGKAVDLVPLPVDDPEFKQAKHAFEMQRALDLMVANGRALGPSGQLIPVAKLKQYENWRTGG